MNKIFVRTLGIGLTLIIVAFNPFVFPGLYIDSTASFSFIASTKIFLLMLLNGILLVIWIIKIQKAQELHILSSRIFFPAFIWLASLIISSLTAVNRSVSFYGMNATLESSFIEGIMIFLLFFIVINNVRTKEDLEEILRFITGGFALAFLYTVIRYLGGWTLESGLFGYYFNNNTFTLIGHYGSLPVIALITSIFGAGMIISDIIFERSKASLIFDSIVLFINSATFAITLNLGGDIPEYLYLIAGVIVFSIIGYIIFSSKKLQRSLIPVFGILILALITGFALHFGIMRNATQPTSYPSLTIDATWNITLDSIKGTLQDGLLGRGPGSFGYAFDVYKNESVALPINNSENQPLITNFTKNAQSPSVEEIRVFQSGSLILGILQSQGLLGIISMIVLVAITITIAVRKGIENIDILGSFAFISFIALVIMSIFARYDFIIMLMLWLSLAIFIIFSSADEPQKNLIIAVTGRSFDFSNNMNYILPSLLLIGVLITIYGSFSIFVGNFYAYQAKQGQIENNIEKYSLNAENAVLSFPESDIFIRESAYADAIRLSTILNEIQQSISSNPESIESPEIQQKANTASDIQNRISNKINIAISAKPNEYKNYYFAGLTLSRTSEVFNLQYDAQAASYFQESLRRNPYHPDSYYQLAKIQLRNSKSESDYVVSRNSIIMALRYRPLNFTYQATYADILKASGNYESAQQIYNALKELKDNNSDNESIKLLYEQQNIDKDIEETKKKIEESKVIPTPNQTPSPTVTPTRNR